MSRQELVRDIVRLKLRIGEEVIGMLPENIRGHIGERRWEILQAVREACTEFLKEERVQEQENEDLKAVAIE